MRRNFDTFDFSAFEGSVNVDLADVGLRTVNPIHLKLTLSSDTGVEDVIGSLFADEIHGNSRDSVLEQLQVHQDFDVILLDLLMPGVNGFDLLGEICNRFTQLPVIVISANEEPHYIRKSIDYGASGFIPKSAAVTLSNSMPCCIGASS